MLLINQNFSFVQCAQADHSWKGQVKFHIGGRITTLGNALFLLAEAITRAAIALIVLIVYALPSKLLRGNDEPFNFTVRQTGHARIALKASWACLLSVYALTTLGDRLMKTSRFLNSMVRETRIRFSTELIQDKLRKEYLHAQNQMVREVDGMDFRYLEGSVGVTETMQIGACDVGICHFIGRRDSMEDAHLATAFDLNIDGKLYPIQLFGIFDGHGGCEASQYLKKHLKDKLAQTLLEFNHNGLTDEGIWNALKCTFVYLNQTFSKKSGSTAIITMTLNGKLWTANVGDSRAILENEGAIIQLSEDAKPADERYKKGIENRGGYVSWNFGMRVNGQIGVARAIGDHSLAGAMSARPKITAIALKDIKPGSHLILGCDGIYDVASTKQIGQAVCNHANQTPGTLAQNLVFSSFKAQSTDNLSLCIIRLYPFFFLN